MNLTRNSRRPYSASASVLNRRQMLFHAGAGVGAWAFLDLVNRDSGHAHLYANDAGMPALISPPKAKSVIFLFMQGGPSQIDTFDPKPLLSKLEGQPLPASAVEGMQMQFTKSDAVIHGCRQSFRKCGESGLEIADTYPHLQTCADDLAIIRSCHHDSFNHAPAQYMMNTGSARMGRPSVGSWVTYGLGSECDELPAFVVMTTTGSVKGGPPVYGHGYLPGTFQPTVLRNAGAPILYLEKQAGVTASDQRELLDMAQWLNHDHLSQRIGDTDDLSSRIASYELAFRMQRAVPDAIDLGDESKKTCDQYGIDDPVCGSFGTNCLIARRLVERGVRFVQVFTGGAGSDDWDAAHADNDRVHEEMAKRVDRPTAALIKDLKSRGLLDETLIIWAGEFGRTPITDGRYPNRPAGRDHNPYGFTVWMAGGGIRGGKFIGATDDFGFRAVTDPIHVNDLHATVLKLLGLDHKQLTYLFQGRQQRLTDVGGEQEFAERLLL